MNRRVLLDTGPLVALLNQRDQYHAWSKHQWAAAVPPFQTCEAVLSEACFLLRSVPNGSRAVMELLRREVIEVTFRVAEHLDPVARLMAKYADLPVSLADACLVCMAEISPEGPILTLDRHFRLFRKNNRQVLPAIMPDHDMPTR